MRQRDWHRAWLLTLRLVRCVLTAAALLEDTGSRSMAAAQVLDRVATSGRLRLLLVSPVAGVHDEPIPSLAVAPWDVEEGALVYSITALAMGLWGRAALPPTFA
jgi:hypothetical protein